jgi:hypothetical protein
VYMNSQFDLDLWPCPQQRPWEKMRCLYFYRCSRIGWKICIYSFSMNFYVFRTQILPPWPWPLRYEHETLIGLLPMFYLVFIPVLRKIKLFLIFLWIFKTFWTSNMATVTSTFEISKRQPL